MRPALFGLFSLLLLQELALRWAFPLPEVLNLDRVSYSPLTLISDRPGLSLGHASFVVASDPDGAEFLHTLNLYGFRDDDWTLDVVGGQRRIAIVGDSMVEGFMAADHETIPEGFQRAAYEAGGGLEVMNFGVGATNIPAYFRMISDVVPLFRPEHVILVLYANDFKPLKQASWFRASLVPSLANPWAPRLAYVLQAASQGRRLPRRWVSEPFSYLSGIPDLRRLWPESIDGEDIDPDIEAAMKRGRFNPFMADVLVYYDDLLSTPVDLTHGLSALQTFLRRQGSALALVYLPSRNQVSDRYLPFQRRYSRAAADSFMGPEYQIHAAALGEASAQLGIPYLDLTSVLREWEAAGQTLFWSYDEHMKGEAYLQVGRALFEWWQSHDEPSARRTTS